VEAFLENCSDKECLEATFGPNAIEMILSMFGNAGIDLPPHLEHLSNQIDTADVESEDNSSDNPVIHFPHFPEKSDDGM
jgi:hypothetical protein